MTVAEAFTSHAVAFTFPVDNLISMADALTDAADSLTYGADL